MEEKPNTSKLADSIVTEALDYRQPAKKILSVLRNNRRTIKFGKHLGRIVYRSRLKYYDSTPDFAMPGLPLTFFDDDWDGDLPSGFFEQFPHRGLLPTMITKDIRHDGKTDPVTEAMRVRNEFRHKLKVSKAKYTKLSAKWIEDDVLLCPEYYIDIAKLIHNEPEIYLNANYNWYYAGKGNLQVLDWCGTEYALHSDFNKLFITPFFRDNLYIDQKHSINYQLDDDLNILETVHSSQFIALRTKHKVIILRINSIEPITVEKVKEIDSNWQFTSASFDEYHKNILYLTTLEWLLIIVNLDRMTKRTVKLRGKYTTLVDNWNSVIGSERGQYVHVSNKSITVYDKRTNEACSRFKSLGNMSDVQDCSRFTGAAYCTGRPQMYVLTTHHIFLMDMRHDKTAQNRIKPIQRWTHGCKVPPCYMSICENTEYGRDMISVSSQWFEDLILLNNHSDMLSRYKKPSNVGLPYRPPSLLDTYSEAQTKKLCCDLYILLEKRLVTSISGLKLLQYDDNEYKVLMLNSLGDISCQSIIPTQRYHFVDDDAPQKLHEWSLNLELEKKPQVCSYVYDINRVFKDLRKVNDAEILGWRPFDAPRHKYSEEQMQRIFEDDEVDVQFLEVWKENPSRMAGMDVDRSDDDLHYETALNIRSPVPMDEDHEMSDEF